MSQMPIEKVSKSVYLSVELVERVEKISEETGLSINFVIATILEREVDAYVTDPAKLIVNPAT